MPYPLFLAVSFEAGFSSAYAAELAAMIGEDLSWFGVSMYSLGEQGDHVLCGSFIEDWEWHCYEPSGANCTAPSTA
jgi:hypothetical protein